MSTATKLSPVDRMATILIPVVEKIENDGGSVGENDQWTELRLPTCDDDYVYDVAVEIRKMRENGSEWWRIALDLGLPGCGKNSDAGKRGAMLARRVWELAWGPTFKRADTPKRRTAEDIAMDQHIAAHRSYFTTDATEAEIRQALTGATVRWVTRLTAGDSWVTSSQEVTVLADPAKVWVKQGPKGRYVEFYEMPDPDSPRLSGPLRSVYIERIVAVIR